MQIDMLDAMFKGWFIGDFSPSVFHTKDVEVAVKFYQKGDKEHSHRHAVATEITVIVQGHARMRGVDLEKGAIVTISPGEYCDFYAVTDVVTVVVKSPSVIGDKFMELGHHD